MALKISGIAELLQNKDAWHAWSKVRDLGVFKPYMTIGDQVRVVKTL